MNKIIEKHKKYKGCVCDFRGASGGITTLWHQDKWNNTTKTVKQHWIKIVFKNNMSIQQLVIYNVYVPNHYRDNIAEEENNNIILGGDLNLILHANEKRGGNFTPDPFRNQLENVMQLGDLVDIIPKNRKFTWSNRRLGKSNIMERLDRILVNVSLLSTFTTVYASILPFVASDHYPTTLTLESHCPWALSPLNIALYGMTLKQQKV